MGGPSHVDGKFSNKSYFSGKKMDSEGRRLFFRVVTRSLSTFGGWTERKYRKFVDA